MTTALPIMTDEEIRRAQLGGDPSPDRRDVGAPSVGLATRRGHLPLRAMEVHTAITGLVATTQVKQVFQNTSREPLEATYIFPLPDRAAVTRFRMEVGARLVEGEILERGRARKAYDEAIEAGHRAAITEEERPGVFTMRVGNLQPGEAATVHLELTGPLPFDSGEATFRFPLVVAQRYIPGEPIGGEDVGDGVSPDTDAVPDASRISPPVLLPGHPNPVRLEITVEIDALGLPVSELRSSLHVVDEQDAPAGRRRLCVRPGSRMDCDFILRFRLGDAALRAALVLNPDPTGATAPEGEQGTFLLTLVPPVQTGTAGRARDVVFVLDRSGSMDGWKMTAARRATARMVDTLREVDRFAVYAFADGLQVVPEFGAEQLVPATDRNRFRAVEFLSALRAAGGTEMAGPLEAAARQLSGGEDDRTRVLVLVTDGQVGNEDQILGRIQPKLKNVRIMALGIDRAVNEGFLRRLAGLGDGLMEIVETEERLDEVMDRIHRRIGRPVVTELRLAPEGLELDALVPSRMPDLFEGAPQFISGRYRGGAASRIAVTGKEAGERSTSPADGTWQLPIEATRAHDPASGAAIAAVWARGRVRELEDRFVTGQGDRDALEREIIETSLRYQVLCRFTAFLAVDRSERREGAGPVHRILQPVEQPQGWTNVANAGSLGLLGAAANFVAAVADCAAAMPAPDARAQRLRSPRAEAPTAEPPGEPAGGVGVRVGAAARALFGYAGDDLHEALEASSDVAPSTGGPGPDAAPPPRGPGRAADPTAIARLGRRGQSMLAALEEARRRAAAAPGALELGLATLAAALGALLLDLEASSAPDRLIEPLRSLFRSLPPSAGPGQAATHGTPARARPPAPAGPGGDAGRDLGALAEEAERVLKSFIAAALEGEHQPERAAFWRTLPE